MGDLVTHPNVVDIAGMTERILDVTAVLDASVCSQDLLTARYAAATLTELADRIETALIALDPRSKALRIAPVA